MRKSIIALLFIVGMGTIIFATGAWLPFYSWAKGIPQEWIVWDVWLLGR